MSDEKSFRYDKAMFPLFRAIVKILSVFQIFLILLGVHLLLVVHLLVYNLTCQFCSFLIAWGNISDFEFVRKAAVALIQSVKIETTMFLLLFIIFTSMFPLFDFLDQALQFRLSRTRGEHEKI